MGCLGVGGPVLGVQNCVQGRLSYGDSVTVFNAELPELIYIYMLQRLV